MVIRYPLRSSPSYYFATSTENPMVKTPNYKQDKRRREDAQKKRNLEEQERQAARKKIVPVDPPRQ
jgi:hypothetical protein